MATQQRTRPTVTAHPHTTTPDPLARFWAKDLPEVQRKLADQRDNTEAWGRSRYDAPRSRADIRRDNTGDLATTETGGHTITVRAHYMPSFHATRITYSVDGVPTWKTFETGCIDVAPDCTGVTPNNPPTGAERI